MSKKWKIGLGAVAALVVIGAIGNAMEDEEKDGAATAASTQSAQAEPADEPTAKEPAEKEPEKPKFDPAAYAAALEQEFKEALGPDLTIDGMCNAENAYTHWGCFYDKLEAQSEGTIRIFLTTDGGWSDSDLKEVAGQAARHWFNFLGPAHEELDTIIVRTNGIDSNHYRRDVPILNR